MTALHTILALLILLAIVCTYSWVAYRIKTTRPEIVVTVPADAVDTNG